LFCFNPELIEDSDKIEDINEKEVFDFLEKQKKWIDGVVISGGEPTLHKDLPELVRKIKKMSFLVRIYTNGTNPKMLKKLIDEKLIDSIAMDIKAPLNEESYERVTGTKGLVEKVKESISFIMNSDLDYEFRTTVVPGLHSEKDVEEIAKHINGANLFILQKFLPENALDSKLKKLNTQSDEEMEKLVNIARKYIKDVKWR
jgi:pyruvate formate lyase activating enzyme